MLGRGLKTNGDETPDATDPRGGLLVSATRVAVRSRARLWLPEKMSTRQVDRGWRDRVRFQILAALGVLCTLAAWSLASSAGAARMGLVPTPQETLITLLDLVMRRTFWADVGATLYRTMLGFSVSIVLGSVAGMGIGLSRTLSAMFGGILDSFKYTPVSAFIPLSIILFGIGDAQKVAILLLGTGPYVAALVAEALRNVPRAYVESALTLGASRPQILLRVLLAWAAPQIWHAMRIALGIAWTYVLTAEIVGTDKGLGRFILRAERFINTREILAAVVVIALIGWLCDICFRICYARWFRWATLTGQQRRAGA